MTIDEARTGWSLFLVGALFLFGCSDSPSPVVSVLEGETNSKQWHTVTLSFAGPESSESATDNPFLNYQLTVEFVHADTTYVIRGFYAADGDAAETGADSGNIWRVRFTPDRTGEWRYNASLRRGDKVALSTNRSDGTQVELGDSKGRFLVAPSDRKSPDFRATGFLTATDGHFAFRPSGIPWLKGGAGSPENLLAFEDFDGTYRLDGSSREGESSAGSSLHAFQPHVRDWQTGDPAWRGGKGKGLVGSLNYLASTGMNAVYFLTMNIGGDGKDVWPYADPSDLTRFDVSKLAQWEIVFQHMQSKGLLLHVVLQETENELMLDGGDTGPQRQLYYRELIARFAHHPALIWNLGEENGPAGFSPNGQNDEQRHSMATFLKQNDPYNHPVVLHTHSHEPARTDVLQPLLGFGDLDGLSLQVDHREGAPAIVSEWRQKAQQAGHDWVISMDEIGMWHTGARTDSLDPTHDSLRRYALWGTLLSGAAGVEWYFGANSTHNDLNSEDWRQRASLWRQTRHAMDLFDKLPWWRMTPGHDLVTGEGGYCLRAEGEVYTMYLPNSEPYAVDLTEAEGVFSVSWFDPISGGEMQVGSIDQLKGGGVRSLGGPPNGAEVSKDWVVVVSRV